MPEINLVLCKQCDQMAILRLQYFAQYPILGQGCLFKKDYTFYAVTLEQLVRLPLLPPDKCLQFKSSQL